MFITALSTIAKIWKQLKCPLINEGKDVVYIHIYVHIHTTEYYSTIKKNGILPFLTTSMDLGGILLGKISQKKNIPHDFTHMWDLRNKTNEENKRQTIKPQTLKYGEQNGGFQKGGGWGMAETDEGN